MFVKRCIIKQPEKMPEAATKQIINLLEGVRIAEGMSYADFVTHFDITYQAYYNMLSSVKGTKKPRKGRKVKPMRIDLRIVERGLESLGYDAHIIITKSREK